MTSKYLFEGSEWDLTLIETLWKHIEKIGRETFKLDPYPAQLEIITSEQMLDCYSMSAMIQLYNHWSFGKSFIQNEQQYQKGQQGLAYEVVVNTNPCIAYLMESNSATMQALVIAHASVAHSHFFKNNYLFKDWTDADTIVDYLKYAKNYIRSCEEKYGEKEVEYLLDACHSLQNHGIDKYKKSPKLSAELAKKRKEQWNNYFETQFNDLWRTIPKETSYKSDEKPFEKEENLLYFIEKYSPILDPWQREIVRIVRKIAQYFYPQRQTGLLNEGCACVKGDTEILTQTGWKKIEDYSGEKIAQYNADGTIEFVLPSNFIINDNKELIEFDSAGFNQCVTPDHRMVYFSSRGHLNEKLAQDLDLNTSRNFISSGQLKTDSKVNLSDVELRIMVAISADGHFNPNTSTKYVQFGFVKERKIRRLESLLKEANISYSITKGTQNRTYINFQAPERNKRLSKYYAASNSQLKIIIDEALMWDGNTSNKRKIVYGTNKEDMVFIQYAAAMTGHKTSFKERLAEHNNCYVVEILRSKKLYLSGGTKTKLAGKHRVYCFSVPSGMFVTKRKEKISVTGNCFYHHAIMTEMHDRGLITDGSYLEFLQSHTSVVTQLDWNHKYFSGINVYALGFAMLTDIKRMCISPDEEDLKWFPDICNTDWIETIKYVIENYRDESFVLQFLSPKVARQFKLFSIGMEEKRSYYEVNATHNDESFLKVRQTLAEQYDLSKSVPQIEIVAVDMKGDRILHLEHRTKNKQRLNYEDARKTTSYIHELWGHPVSITYVDLDGNPLDEVR